MTAAGKSSPPRPPAKPGEKKPEMRHPMYLPPFRPLAELDTRQLKAEKAAIVKRQKAGAYDADDRVGRFPDGGVGNVLDPDVVYLVHDGCAHGLTFPWFDRGAARSPAVSSESPTWRGCPGPRAGLKKKS